MCGSNLQALVIAFGLGAPYAPVDHTIEVYFHVIRMDTLPSAGGAGNVLRPGDSAQVEVWAHPPAEAYAFAAAEFEMDSEMPGWRKVSDGAIAGPQVQEIAFSQDHNPVEGVFADPSNPLRIWTGMYSPARLEPRLLRVQATPSAFSYFPSESTSSSVEVDAAPGHGWLLVNPLTVGEMLIAPGTGTTIAGGDGRDLLIGGLGGDLQDVVFGFVGPIGQRVGIEPETPPTGLTYEMGLEETDARPGPCYCNFNFTVSVGGDSDSTYNMHPDWPLASEYEYRVSAIEGQTIVMRIDAFDNAGASLNLERIPNAYSSRIQLDRRANQTRVISRCEFDEPVEVIAPDGRVLQADTIEVHGIRDGLTAFGIGEQVFQVSGAGKVRFADLGGVK